MKKKIKLNKISKQKKIFKKKINHKLKICHKYLKLTLLKLQKVKNMKSKSENLLTMIQIMMD